jgi:aldose 1-epimerase
MSRTLLSGTQYTLQTTRDVVHVASVGASLRRYTHDGRDLVVPFEADQVRPAYRGAILAPWPNRILDGRYQFGGEEYQLGITEPKRGHALHGLAVWLGFHAVAERSDSLILVATVEPQEGYPWRIRLETTYNLGADGLTQTVRATNESSTPAPFGTAAHPYLVAGLGQVDEWVLELPARQVLLTDDKLRPTDLVDIGVDVDRFDFRCRRLIGSAEIDHAFTALQRDSSGHATVRLLDQAGQGVAMTWDAACPWV